MIREKYIITLTKLSDIICLEEISNFDILTFNNSFDLTRTD
jgi:hypothetical protein